MSSSNNLLSAVPILNADNYEQWETCLIAYCRFSKISRVLFNMQPSPIFIGAVAATATTAAIPATVSNQDEIDDWEEMDGSVRGLIVLRIPSSMHHIVRPLSTARNYVDELKRHFGTPGPASIFTDFKDAIHFQLAEKVDPTLAMTSLQSLFSKLDDLGLKLAESVKCMILLAALPKSWENLAASILANKTLDTIKLDPIVSIIRDEWARRHSAETGVASRISGVKRKGNNPNWSDQKQAKQPKQEQTSGGPKPEQKKTDAAADEGEKKKKKAEKRKAKKAKKAAAAAAGTSTGIEVATLSVPDFIQGSSTSPLQPILLSDRIFDQPTAIKSRRPSMRRSVTPEIAPRAWTIDKDGYYEGTISSADAFADFDRRLNVIKEEVEVINEGTDEVMMY